MRKITLLLVGLAICTLSFNVFASGFKDTVDMYTNFIVRLHDGGGISDYGTNWYTGGLVSNTPQWVKDRYPLTWHQAVNAGQLYTWVSSGGGGGLGDFITKTNHDGKVAGKKLTFDYLTNYPGGNATSPNFIVYTNRMNHYAQNTGMIWINCNGDILMLSTNAVWIEATSNVVLNAKNGEAVLEGNNALVWGTTEVKLATHPSGTGNILLIPAGYTDAGNKQIKNVAPGTLILINNQ